MFTFSKDMSIEDLKAERKRFIESQLRCDKKFGFCGLSPQSKVILSSVDDIISLAIEAQKDKEISILMRMD